MIEADKGGAILIMNYTDVEESITKEIFNNNKLEEIHQTNADEHIITVRKRVNDATIDRQGREKIVQDGKTICTGLTDKNKPKQFPYTYVLFKIHKLRKKEIAQKKVPPVRVIHVSKYSPLYRMEKLTSPCLTKMSRNYCKHEFIVDTKHILKMMNELNSSNTINNNSCNLFTIDVEKLYLSIQPHPAEEAITDLLANVRDEEVNNTEAVKEFV